MPQLPFTRLNQIRSGQEFKHYRLLRKYGGMRESMLAFDEKARANLETITNAAEKLDRMQTKEGK